MFDRLIYTLLIALSWGVVATAQTNRVLNASFEQGQGAAAEHWIYQVHTQDGARGSVARVAGEAPEGGAYLRLLHESDDVAWVRASQEPIQAGPETPYRFEAWVKATGRFAVYCYERHAGSYPAYHVVARGEDTGGQWRRVQGGFRTGAAVDALKLSLISDGPGEVWIDEVVLAEVDETTRGEAGATVARTTAPMDVDGRLDEAFWQDATRLGPLLKLGEEVPAEPATHVRVATDGQELRIGFECIEPATERMTLGSTEDGYHVYHDDCVEVFIDPDGDGSGYYHLIVTPRGFKGGQVFPGARLAQTWYDMGGAPQPVNDGWEAAGVIGEGRWTAEMRIPLERLGATLLNEKPWRINFARERRAGAAGAEYQTWAYLPGDSFHAPSLFGRLGIDGDEVRPASGAGTRFHVWPRPQQLAWQGGQLELPQVVTVSLPQTGLKGPALAAVEAMAEELRSRFGREVQIVHGGAGHATIRLVLDGDWVAPVPERGSNGKLVAGFPSVAQQASRLRIDPGGIQLAANHPEGLRLGVSTLRNLIAQAPRPAMPCLEAVDWPDYQVRGLQLMCPFPGEQDLFRELVDLAELMKFNRLWLRMDDRLVIPSRPGLGNRTAFDPEGLKPLIEYARSRGLEVVPEQSLYSHTDYWLTNREGYADLGDGPKATNVDPRNPRTRRVLTDIVDTLLETFDTPRAFNITHDELTHGAMGQTPHTRGVPPHELLAESLNHWHDYLESRGVETVYAYGDPLKLGMGSTGGLPYHLYKARPLLDKSLVIVDWIYGPADDYPTLDTFLEDGFRVVPATWYRPVNIQNFTRAGVRRGVAELMATTWQQDFWFETEPEMQMCLVLNGAYGWNTAVDLDAWEILPSDYFTILRERAEAVPQETVAAPIDLAPKATADLAAAEFLGGRRVPSLPVGETVVARGVPFKLGPVIQLARDEGPAYLPPAAEGLGAGVRARQLVLLQSTSLRPAPTTSIWRRYQEERQVIATYVIHYEGGETVEFPITFRQQVTDWNDYAGCSKAWMAWRGTTGDGASFQLYAFTWDNPHPERTIERIDMISGNAFVSPVLLAITALK